MSVATTSGAESFTLSVAGIPGATVSSANGTATQVVSLNLDIASLATGTYVGALGVYAPDTANQYDSRPGPAECPATRFGHDAANNRSHPLRRHARSRLPGRGSRHFPNTGGDRQLLPGADGQRRSSVWQLLPGRDDDRCHYRHGCIGQQVDEDVYGDRARYAAAIGHNRETPVRRRV